MLNVNFVALQLIEYTGEIIRQSVADRREHLIYNKLVVSNLHLF